jgi:hypothetical protein
VAAAITRAGVPDAGAPGALRAARPHRPGEPTAAFRAPGHGQPTRAAQARTRAIVACAAAAASLAAAACSAGGGPAGAPLTPRQALLAAATRTRQASSGTATVTVHTAGNQNTTMTAKVRFRLKPALEVSEDLTVAAGGTITAVKAILTGTVLYHPPR